MKRKKSSDVVAPVVGGTPVVGPDEVLEEPIRRRLRFRFKGPHESACIMTAICKQMIGNLGSAGYQRLIDVLDECRELFKGLPLVTACSGSEVLYHSLCVMASILAPDLPIDLLASCEVDAQKRAWIKATVGGQDHCCFKDIHDFHRMFASCDSHKLSCRTPSRALMLAIGFSCKTFSKLYSGRLANVHALADGGGSSGSTYQASIKVVRSVRPLFGFFENVPEADDASGVNMAIVNQDFFALGYLVDWRVMNAVEYGLPQTRQRLYIAFACIEDFGGEALACEFLIKTMATVASLKVPAKDVRNFSWMVTIRTKTPRWQRDLLLEKKAKLTISARKAYPGQQNTDACSQQKASASAVVFRRCLLCIAKASGFECCHCGTSR